MITSDRDRGQRTVSGRVNGDGSIQAGTGFTVTRSTTGLYAVRVQGLKAIIGMSMVVIAGASLIDGGSGPTQPDTITVRTFLVSTSPADASFSFSVTGLPR